MKLLNDEQDKFLKENAWGLTNQELTATELESIEAENWVVYSSDAYVTTPGKNIIYVRVTDNYGDFTYINSDYKMARVLANRYKDKKFLPQRRADFLANMIYKDILHLNQI